MKKFNFKQKKFFRKRPTFSNVNINYNDLHPSKINTSQSLYDSFTGRAIKIYPGEDTERFLRRFKKVVEASGILGELKKREFYKSPGQLNREKKLKSRKRFLRNKIKQEQFFRDSD